MCVSLCSKEFSTLLVVTVLQRMQGAWRSFPSHANEAMGNDWKGNWTQFPVPAKKLGP